MPDFFGRGAKGRAFSVGDEIIYGEIMAAGFKPSAHRLNVQLAFARLDRAEEGVFENPVKRERRFVTQKIRASERRPQPRRSRSLGAQMNGTGSDVVAVNPEASLGPRARIMASPTAGNADGLAG